jgi:hypothetical protein
MGAPLGNKNNAKGRMLTEALRKAVIQYESKECPQGQAPHKIATNIVELAVKDSDRWAIEMLYDRLDGKPEQAIKHTGTVAIESVSDEQARLMAEALIDAARTSVGVRAEEPDRVHDSVSPGLPGSTATP